VLARTHIATLAVLGIAGVSAALLAIPRLAEGSRQTAPLEAPDRVDLGTHRYGESVPYEFSIRNTSSSRDLVIDSITSACACTTTAEAPLVIPKGGSISLSGVYSLSSGPVHSDRAAIPVGAPSLHLAPTPVTIEGAGWRRQIEVEATLVAPLVLTSAHATTGWTFEPHPLYRGQIERLEFYLPGAAEPLVHTSSTSAPGLQTYTLAPQHQGASVLEAVIHLTGAASASETSFSLVHRFALPDLSP